MLDKILEKLEKNNRNKKIIYPDIDDQRVYDAVSHLYSLWESPLICGKVSELERYESLIEGWLQYFEIPEWQENTVFAADKLKSWEVDGFIWGNISTTSAVVKALIKNVWSQEGISRISSHFIMSRGEDVLLFSDAGIQVDPNAQQLAEIAYLTIQSALKYSMQPRVALLSFSTAGSWWDTPSTLKIRQAKLILEKQLQKEGLWDIPVEWEIQFDAAFIPEIGQKKNPSTNLLQSANVFIFPDLDSANIAYKITERLAWFTALWPIIQWLAKPGNDLSRGCSTQDIIDTHHITKNK